MRTAFIITGLVVLLAAIFKIQHWAGGGILATLGLTSLFVVMTISSMKAFGKKVARPVSGIERIHVAFLLFGILFKIMHWPGAGILLTVTLSSLSLIYLGTTWLLLSNEQVRPKAPKNIGSILIGMGYSLVAIGILFQTQHWPGGRIQVMAGLIATVFSHVVHLFLNRNAEKPYQWTADAIIRAAVIIGWGAYSLL